MLVSTREATRQASLVVVKILSRPTPVGWGWVSAVFFQFFGLKPIQPLGAFIKQLHPLLRGQSEANLGLAPDQFHPNAFPRGNPLQFVPWTDAVLVGDLFRDGQL